MHTTSVVTVFQVGRGRSRLVRATGAVAAFLLALCLVEHFVAERVWWGVMLTYTPQQWTLVLPVPLLIAALVRRRWKLAGANLGSLCFIAFALMGFCGRGQLPAPPRSEAVHLRVMTFNIAHGEGGIDHIAQTVRSVQPEVVCFNEVNVRKPGARNPYPALRHALPEYTFTPASETVIGSRVPITQTKSLPSPGKGFNRRSVLATVETQAGAVTIIAAHLATAVNGETLGIHRGGLPAYLTHTAAVRQTQVTDLLSTVADQNRPVILCGDFNTPPRGRIYGQLTRRMTDTFAARGSGFGHTYPGKNPLLRIDYIFTANGAAAHSCRVVTAPASDHRAVVADITLSKL